jgi:hypothetical protein
LWFCPNSETSIGSEVLSTGWMHRILYLTLSVLLLLPDSANAQTASTGSLRGETFDSSGSLVSGVTLEATNSATGESQTTISDDDGRFTFLFLIPGTYDLQGSKQGYAPSESRGISIFVTETHRFNVHLQLETVLQKLQVSSEASTVQTDNSVLGWVVDQTMLNNLPLVTRNFAQVAALSPGVAAGVFNAGELGLGGTSLSQIANSNDGIFVHGARSYDNNWQIDGISVSDVQGSGSGSGGIPIPNPDSLQEFKVQTALYDAGYGRYAGANISVITKPGSDDYHATVFEFLRNDVLNANDFFFNQVGEPRPTLKQNQFGFSLGGPIRRDALFFFGSYQGTRQANGLAAGQARVACSGTLTSPPLTNDRSSAALGQLFGGMSGALGGVAIRSDGSNINPAALALLNLKLPDGTFLIPTPQTIDASRPLASQGLSVFTEPCEFDEDQALANADFVASQRSRIAGRLFFANDSKSVSFPGNFFNPIPNIPGFASPNKSGYRVVSVAYTYASNNAWLNELRVGYVRTTGRTKSTAPLKWSDVGVVEGEMSHANELPNLNIVGSVAFSSAFPFDFTQNSSVVSDALSLVHRAHTLRFGGSLTRIQDNFGADGTGSFVQFLSWPDFLLGLSASDNGTGTFSDVFASIDNFGLFDRKYRAWEASLFAQDDYEIRKSLFLNLGLRYERLGQFGDKLGRNSSFDITEANPQPSANGSVAGYLVSSSFPGVPPLGVRRVDNDFGNYGEGQNTIAPRFGLAWRVPSSSGRLAVRGGYGMYYSRPTGQAFFQNGNGSPFALLRTNIGSTNKDASLQAPFPQPFPRASSFPSFTPYSPEAATSIFTTSPGFRPAVIQQFSLNVQGEIHKGWLVEAAYVGTRGTRLQRVRSLNQARDASPEKPIRGVTSNTIMNLPLRVPIVGISADSLDLVESAGSSWYNGLELSLTKAAGSGVQFQASYTFSKTLDTDGSDINRTSSGTGLTLGNQNSPRQRWGRASFDRTHRFVFSTVWTLPHPAHGLARAVLGNWFVSGVVTVQSGAALTIADTNPTNVYGISEDRAQLSGTCTKDQIVNSGPIQSKLNRYFNRSCFTTPSVIGADGVGTGFGNSATGLVDGPGQANLDVALSRTVGLNRPIENTSVRFRAEFFNALNHAQFANPDTNFSSPTFGAITRTSVNPRVSQLALQFSF